MSVDTLEMEVGQAVDEQVEDRDLHVVPEKDHKTPYGQIPETAVDALLASLRSRLLDEASDKQVRKSIPVTQQDRRKVRRRNVDTDVPLSELVFDAVVDLLKNQDEVQVASSRAAKNRTQRLTVNAPAWWWRLVALSADSVGGQHADVISAAIGRRLP